MKCAYKSVYTVSGGGGGGSGDPYLTGNNESCTTSSTQAGDTYVMVRGYQTFSGVSLIASY